MQNPPHNHPGGWIESICFRNQMDQSSPSLHVKFVEMGRRQFVQANLSPVILMARWGRNGEWGGGERKGAQYRPGEAGPPRADTRSCFSLGLVWDVAACSDDRRRRRLCRRRSRRGWKPSSSVACRWGPPREMPRAAVISSPKFTCGRV